MEKGKDPYLLLPTIGQQFHARRISWLPEENVPCENDMPAKLVGFINSLPNKKPRIGVSNLQEIPLGICAVLKESNAEFVDITLEFTEMKANKSELEISLIKYVSNLAVKSFEDVVRKINVGKTEWEIIGGAEGYMRSLGAEELLILTRSQKSHSYIAKPTSKKIGPDDVFVYSVEIAGPYGYWIQLIRPIFMSRKAHPDAYAIWQVIKEQCNFA